VSQQEAAIKRSVHTSFETPTPHRSPNRNIHRDQSRLTGTIPESWGGLTRLEKLRLLANKELVGCLPGHIGTLAEHMETCTVTSLDCRPCGSEPLVDEPGFVRF